MDIAEYTSQMRKAPQFTRLGLEPKWAPGTGDIDGFIHDEVVRQGHDPRVEDDGGRRIIWMKTAWQYAQDQATSRRVPTVEDILHVAAFVEPGKNQRGYRVYNVTIGDSRPPDAREVPRLVEELWKSIDKVMPATGNTTPYYKTAGFGGGYPTADDFYLEFERIHPFGDGNGRTGKILHNWLLDQLEDPVLVPDYFGGGNP